MTHSQLQATQSELRAVRVAARTARDRHRAALTARRTSELKEYATATTTAAAAVQHARTLEKRMARTLRQHALSEETLLGSGKFRRLAQLLPQLRAGGHRVLIFSFWTRPTTRLCPPGTTARFTVWAT